MPNRIRKHLSGTRQGPWILVSALLVALLVTPFAVAAGEGRSLLGGARNPGANESQALTRETEIIADNATYGTRQSNKSDNGGGAIYGCRSKAGGTPQRNEPCIRVNNLSNGRAFEFVTGIGDEVGRIESANPNAAPFTTNAQGVAGGLNADRVDSKSADDIVKDAQALNRFAAVSGDGTLAGGRGASAARRVSAGLYEVDFAADVSACAYSATQTTVDADSGSTAVQRTDADTIRVQTRNNAAPAVAADKPLHLTVIC